MCGPQAVGRIHCAAFTDDVLFAEMAAKATFWQQRAFYGVDLTCLFEPALDGYFAQVCAPVTIHHFAAETFPGYLGLSIGFLDIGVYGLFQEVRVW